MIKILYILALCVFFTSFSYFQSDCKFWDSDKLSGKDFGIIQDTLKCFGLDCPIETPNDNFKQKFTAIIRHVTMLYTEHEHLQIHLAQNADQYLTYKQVLFEIGELDFKKLQRIIVSNISKKITEDNLWGFV